MPADDQAPGEARARIEGIRSRLGPSYETLLLVISELVSNCVRHTDADSVELSLAVSDSTIRLEVTDAGPGFDARTSMVGDGLGLVIVDRVADSWGVQVNGHCTVWVEIPR